MTLSVYRLYSISNLVNLFACKKQNEFCSDVNWLCGTSCAAQVEESLTWEVRILKE
jgi:hypothetical protein